MSTAVISNLVRRRWLTVKARMGVNQGMKTQRAAEISAHFMELEKRWCR